MKRKFGIILIIVITIIVVNLLGCITLYGENLSKVDDTVIGDDTVNKIETYVKKQMKDSKIPGMAVNIVKGDKVIYQKGFGYSDISSSKRVDSKTLFEMGSNSKAYTAVLIYILEEEKLLSINDSVSKYIPWFYMTYDGKNQQITIEQLLHHTSGIAFKTIGDIPQDESAKAIENTVRILVGKELGNKPGSVMEYATINYDVLGLIIEKITGKTFEEYAKDELLVPLGLKNTLLDRKESQKSEFMSKGYKLNFLRQVEYDAPSYNGNLPAGYFISNSDDICKWLIIQINKSGLSQPLKRSIEKTHIPDNKVLPGDDGSSYASGWYIIPDGGGEILHDGSNPNFSSFIDFRPEEKIGVAVMANLNSQFTSFTGKGIMDILMGKAPKENKTDIYLNGDKTSTAIILISILLMIAVIYFMGLAIVQLIKSKRKFKGRGLKGFLGLIFSMAFMAFFIYCIFRVPDVLFYGLSWDFIKVWAPESLITALYAMVILGFLFYVYYLFIFFFKKVDTDKSIFDILIVSIFSGFGNAFLIFSVNLALAGNDDFRMKLLLYFVFGIILYIVGQRVVRMRLVSMTNNMVYEKRMSLVERTLKAPFYKFDTLEEGKILAGLNNDTEVISNYANTFITGVTSMVTLVCCLVYLGMLNIKALLASLVIVILALVFYYLIGTSANKLWEQTRDIQNVFFKFINDLIGGFKELSLNDEKRKDFKEDFNSSCKLYRDKRKAAEYKFANAFIIGELVFTIVIGAVAFLLPTLFKGIEISVLSNFIFIFLYMMGPIHSILGAIPETMQMRISWNKIKDLEKQLEIIEDLENNKTTTKEKKITLKLKDVEYSYKTDGGDDFRVGPIDLEFKTGETIFITGGNGSGKSTLAKLMTGLYVPSKGHIMLNGRKIKSDRLGQYYSTIFSDFYLFEKLYGIDYKDKLNDIKKYLKVLHIDNKVEIKDGRFSTVRLSTGQRKRLALLVSYLEDRPIYLFDEWAADQDPEFRKFFYDVLLPQLKDKGKCVIAITHDDRYFHKADKMIKMEFGKVV